MESLSTSTECLLDGLYDSLEAIGVSGPLIENGGLENAVQDGLSSPQFIELCTHLCTELKALNNMQEVVSTPGGPSDKESFEMEMRSFLIELGCPHASLSERGCVLEGFENRLMLVDFLLSELMSSRLLARKKKEEDSESRGGGPPLNDIAGNLTAILKVYGIASPPPNVTVQQVFQKIINKTRELVKAAPKDHLAGGMIVQPLSDDQWALLDKINNTLMAEYAVRREMLLTRCDVTIQSFNWSQRAKEKGEELVKAFQSDRSELRSQAPVSMARLLAARSSDLLCVERTSSGAVRKASQCSINKVMIGRVPDRGGRPQETRPPPEMPSFKQRTESQRGGWGGGGGGGGYQGGGGGGSRRGGRGGGGGGGRGGGGRVQGGWAGGGRGGGMGGKWQQKEWQQSGTQQQQSYYGKS